MGEFDEEDAAKNQVVTWMQALPPIAFSLTSEGALMVEFALAFGNFGLNPRMGLVIPPEEVKILLRNLGQIETIQETLTAKRPTPGAH